MLVIETLGYIELHFNYSESIIVLFTSNLDIGSFNHVSGS